MSCYSAATEAWAMAVEASVAWAVAVAVDVAASAGRAMAVATEATGMAAATHHAMRIWIFWLLMKNKLILQTIEIFLSSRLSDAFKSFYLPMSTV